jgi:hypothetical protein
MSEKVQTINIDYIQNIDIPDNGKKYRFLVESGDNNFLIEAKNINGKVWWTSLKSQKTLSGEDMKYKLKILEKNKVTKEYLYDICPDFHNIKKLIDKTIKTKVDYDNNIDSENKTFLIKGFMQSKKTWAIIATALYYYQVYNTTVFIITENKLSALEQLSNRINEEFNKYKKFIKTKNIDDVFKILCGKRGKYTNENELTQAMNKVKPRIYFCMRSKTDIQPINNILENLNKNYVIIQDESDAIDTNTTCDAQAELDKLKENAKTIFHVTATALTTLMKDDIDKGHVVVMKKPENYKDLPTFNFVNLDNESNPSSGKADNPFENDPNLEDYIRKLSKKESYEVDFWGGQKHPVISLIRVGMTVEPQLKIAKYIHKNYKNIVTITYNGTGITMRGSSLPDKSVIVEGEKSHYYRNVHNFSELHIGNVISYLQNNIQTDIIVILAGKMADRGITFGNSSYKECVEKKQVPWHLTEMYYLASKTTEQPNLLQTVGRLCGCHLDNIPLTLYSNVCNDIIKAYHAQEELIERARKARFETNIIKDIIPEISMNKDKCSSRRFTTSSVYCRINKVDDDSKDGGWDWEKLGFIDKKEDEKQEIIDPNLEDEIIWVNSSKLSQSLIILYEQIKNIMKDEEEIKRSNLQKKLHELMPNINKQGLYRKISNLHDIKMGYCKNISDKNKTGIVFYRKKNSIEWTVKYNKN